MYSASDISEEVAAKLPEPQGYKLLIAVPEVNSKTEGGVFLPDSRVGDEKVASIIGLVIKCGPDAYQDMDKFASGPYCKQGDFVIFRSYSGTRFKIKGDEFRLINDDTVEAVVADPRGYERA